MRKEKENVSGKPSKAQSASPLSITLFLEADSASRRSHPSECKLPSFILSTSINLISSICQPSY